MIHLRLHQYYICTTSSYTITLYLVSRPRTALNTLLLDAWDDGSLLKCTRVIPWAVGKRRTSCAGNFLQSEWRKTALSGMECINHKYARASEKVGVVLARGACLGPFHSGQISHHFYWKFWLSILCLSICLTIFLFC